MNGSFMLEPLPQVILYACIAPGVAGFLCWIKARLQGRRGPKIWQPYLDLYKLFQQRAVIPDTASWVFFSAPCIVFGCYTLLGAVVPVVYLAYDPLLTQAHGLPLADFLMVAALIGLARFAISIAGMDSGSPFGGIGSSRELFIQVLVEPVYLIAAYGLALTAHTTSISGVIAAQIQGLYGVGATFLQNFPAHLSGPLILFVSLALALVMLAEAGCIPFDHPAARQELSMGRGAIHLEYGGYNLALLKWADAMRLTFFMTFLVNLLFPDWLASEGKTWIQNALLVFAYPLKIMILIILLGLWEETRARLRLRSVIPFAGLAFVLSMIAIILVFVWSYS